MPKNEDKQTKSKKPLILKILAIALLLIFVYVGWIYYKLETGQLFLVGGEVYTREEAMEKWPDKYHVEAKNTPEEVYSKFRQALLDDDIETALECIEKEERERYGDLLSKNDLPEIAKQYPEEIKKDQMHENRAIYSFNFKKENNNLSGVIKFIKKQNGYWKIEAI